MKNQKGFMTLSMLILMPMILAIAAVAVSGALSIRAAEKTEMICREGVLQAQTHMLSSYEKLISLNPIAKMLRAADKASKLSLVIPFYGVISAASVQEARMIFHSVQLSLITSANLRMKADLLTLKLQLAKSLGFESYGFLDSEILNSPLLAVEAKPQGNLTPDYFAQKDFADLQLIQMSWMIRLGQLLPDFLIDLLSSKNSSAAKLTMNLKCASSVQRNQTQEDKWQATLIEKNKYDSQTIKARQLLSWF